MGGLAGLFMGLALAGVPIGWVMLLNLRDGREARLLGTVLDCMSACMSARDLRGRVGVQVRCGVLWPRSVVRVRLELTGPVEGPVLLTFTLEPALCVATR